MQKNATALRGIFDIESPHALMQSTFEINTLQLIVTTVGIFCATLVIAILLWYRYFSDRGQARRALNVLHRRIQQQQIAYQAAVFEMTHILQKGLRITQITSNTCLPEKMVDYHNHWHAFVGRLSVVKYSTNKLELTQMEQLLREAHDWLRRWPRFE